MVGSLSCDGRKLKFRVRSQVHDVLVNLVRPFHWIVPGILVGGEKKKAEKARLRKGLTVVVGTPGRLSDHVSTTQCWDVSKSQFLILDEADRLMDMGFERDITRICRHVKETRSKQCKNRLQSVLVSATLDSRVRSLASASLSTPTVVSDEITGDAAVGQQVLDPPHPPRKANFVRAFVPRFLNSLRLTASACFVSCSRQRGRR